MRKKLCNCFKTIYKEGKFFTWKGFFRNVLLQSLRNSCAASTACVSALISQNTSADFKYSYSGQAAGAGNVTLMTYTTLSAGASSPPTNTDLTQIAMKTGVVMTGTVNVYVIYYGVNNQVTGGSGNFGNHYASYFGNVQGGAAAAPATAISNFINGISSTSWWSVVQTYKNSGGTQAGIVTLKQSVSQRCNDEIQSYGCQIDTGSVQLIVLNQIF